MFETGNPDFFAGTNFVANVNLTGRILSDQNHGKPGLVSVLLKRLNAIGKFPANLLSQFLAVDEFRDHTVLFPSVVFFQLFGIVRHPRGHLERHRLQCR